MQLLLPSQVSNRLERELRRAGRQEIGGVLMGEHLHDEVFRIVEISVQRSGGTQACFIRNPSDHQAQLEQFFARYGNDYVRYNYLGEWHSHPSFDPMPSTSDMQTMQSIVDDPAVGVNFAVLLITKLGNNKRIEATAMAFRSGMSAMSVPLQAEAESHPQPEGIAWRWLRKIFRF
jgi:integrative and conjugative element protein (TIGR02256 family)